MSSVQGDILSVGLVPAGGTSVSYRKERIAIIALRSGLSGRKQRGDVNVVVSAWASQTENRMNFCLAVAVSCRSAGSRPTEAAIVKSQPFFRD